ncbi:hypothetical protein SALBM217S_01371 [Streptomyces griseoloalbus]
MLSFHAAYSLGGIVGASLAWVGAHFGLALWVSYLPVVLVLLPAALVGSRWYVDGEDRAPAEKDAVEAGAAGGLKWLLPLVMTVAYIGDSTVSNWSAKYLQDVLGSSEQTATVPYNVYMVTTLLGRAVGDAGVRRFGAVAVVRAGALVGCGRVRLGGRGARGVGGDARVHAAGSRAVRAGAADVRGGRAAGARDGAAWGVGRGRGAAERLQLRGFPGRFAVGGSVGERLELSRGDAGADGVGAGDARARPFVRAGGRPIRWRA